MASCSNKQPRFEEKHAGISRTEGNVLAAQVDRSEFILK